MEVNRSASFYHPFECATGSDAQQHWRSPAKRVARGEQSARFNRIVFAAVTR
jgi:hypothetical protein